MHSPRLLAAIGGGLLVRAEELRGTEGCIGAVLFSTVPTDYISALVVMSWWNQHCADCIGTVSLPSADYISALVVMSCCKAASDAAMSESRARFSASVMALTLTQCNQHRL